MRPAVELLNGNEATARAVRLAAPQVIPVYLITPPDGTSWISPRRWPERPPPCAPFFPLPLEGRRGLLCVA